MPDTRRTLSALQTLLADNVAGDISAQDGRDELISSHPEKTCQSDTQANEPASERLAGDLFLPSDGFQAERYSGSAWQPWGPLFPFTKPVDGDFAWINQGSAAVSTTKGGIYLSAPANAPGHNWRIRKKAAPATPYTITAAFLLAWDWSLTNGNGITYGGLVWRQSSDGKLVSIDIQTVTSASVWNLYNVQKWTSESAFSATYVAASSMTRTFSPIVWMRLQDDGTNRKIHISADGQNFIQVHTVGRTDFLTADEVGFAINPYGVAQGMTLLSWAQA